VGGGSNRQPYDSGLDLAAMGATEGPSQVTLHGDVSRTAPVSDEQ